MIRVRIGRLVVMIDASIGEVMETPKMKEP